MSRDSLRHRRKTGLPGEDVDGCDHAGDPVIHPCIVDIEDPEPFDVDEREGVVPVALGLEAGDFPALMDNAE